MAIRDIIKVPDPRLREVCAPVLGGEDVGGLVQDLFDTAASLHTVGDRACKAVGLAAPQIGVLKRVLVINVEGIKLAMLNPEIVRYKKGADTLCEWCFSEPDTHAHVFRHLKIDVAYREYTPGAGIMVNSMPTLVTRRFVDFPARVVQHEIDHLNGVLLGKDE